MHPTILRELRWPSAMLVNKSVICPANWKMTAVLHRSFVGKPSKSQISMMTKTHHRWRCFLRDQLTAP